MRPLLDKHELGLIEGVGKRTIHRRLLKRTDFPKPVVGDSKTNARLQWFGDDLIKWYSKHPEIVRNARRVVEFVMNEKRPKKNATAVPNILEKSKCPK